MVINGAKMDFLPGGVLEDVMEAMFGSNSKIYATREGFEVEDFGGEHD